VTAAIFVHGDARQIPLADGVAQTCVTSPPYWGLRDYGLEPSVWGGEADCEHVWDVRDYQRRSNDGGDELRKQVTSKGSINRDVPVKSAFCQRCGAWRGCLGLEPTPELYVAHMVEIFREVRRVLRDDGTLWLVLGDSYAGGNYRGGGVETASAKQRSNAGTLPFMSTCAKIPNGLKPKDMCGIPWRVAFALQADGWWLRSDIVWAKPNPMPESVTDRPTKAHEYVFLLAKRLRYYYDAEAVKEPAGTQTWPGIGPQHGIERDRGEVYRPMAVHHVRNRRSVWSIATRPYSGAHFACYPPDLVEPCILAGSAAGDLVLDPFCGSGTTGMVAVKHGRRFVGVDRKRQYLSELAVNRVDRTQMRLGAVI